MRYIAFSIDDGRQDTYSVAMPIMDKHGLVGTVNLISDGFWHPDKYQFPSSAKSMTIEQAQEWQKWGGEIASHSSTHANSAQEIVQSIEELKQAGIDVKDIGFASPESWLTEENLASSGIGSLLSDGTVSYARSGIQVRREGLFYTGLSVLERFIHSGWLYYLLNKRTFIRGKKRIYSSAAIKAYTTVSQVQRLVGKLADDEALILMLHSVLPKGDPGYGADQYYWDADRFDQLCRWISGQKDICVLTVQELVKRMEA